MTATRDGTISELQRDNAELQQRLDAALARETALAEVFEVINRSPADPGPVFETILEKAHSLCGADIGALATYDGEFFRQVASHGLSTEFRALTRDPWRPTTRQQELVRGARFVHIADVQPIMLKSQDMVGRGLVETTGVRTFLQIPLRRDGALLGFIGAHRTEIRPYTDSEISLLENFAAQAVIAMENARLLGELRERTEALAERNAAYSQQVEYQSATIDVLKVMSSSTSDAKPVFDIILSRAMTLCECMLGTVYEFDGEQMSLHAGQGFEPDALATFALQYPKAPTGTNFAERAILDRRIYHVRDLAAEWPARPQASRDLGHRSVVAVPLLRDGTAVGVIVVMHHDPDRFRDSHIELLKTFAEQAVIAIASVANFRALRERTAELAQRQVELRVTFENMGDGVAMFDDTQHLIAWNRKFQDMLDVPDAIIAQRQTFPDYIRYLAERGEYGSGANVETQVRRLLEGVGQMRVLERARPNGRVIEVRNNPIASGGFVLIYSDITERKRNEAELVAARDAAEQASRTIESAYRQLKIAQANLVQAEKMASLGQLTAGIAHEIKNPLNFVNNFAELSADLLEELKHAIAPAEAALTTRQRDDVDDVVSTLTSNLQKITEHGKRADSIVKAMLEHSRGASGERRTVDINALADEALNLAYHGARAQDQSFNITLERDFGQGIAPIQVNPQDITRVLLNLFSNGFYAANKRTQSADGAFRPTLRLTTRAVGDAVEIRVRDNGTGIPAEIRDKLFQPFFTTKPTGEGTGLGLSITYDIVTKAHGGAISVDSEVDAFTEFVVALPYRMFAGG